MIAKVLAVFGFVAVAYAADLTMGGEGGRLIFDQNITASPAIWRQVQVLTVNTTNTTDEVISRVVIIDNRPEKDGEATVVEGGEGQRNVTLELKSPAVFRGFDFSIQVFATEANVYGQNPQVLKDLNVNSNQEPKDGGDIIIGAPAPTASSTTEVNKDDQQKINPASVGQEQPRLNRDTEEQMITDQTSVPTPVEVYVNKDIKVNENANTTEQTEMDESLNTELDSIYENNSPQKTEEEDAQKVPVEVYVTKDIRVNEHANTTEQPEMDESLKTELDSIYENNSTQITEEEDKQKVVPVIPEAESDDLINYDRKVRQAYQEPDVPALHTIPKSELSSTTQESEPSTVPSTVPSTEPSTVPSTEPSTVPSTEPSTVPVTDEVPSTTQANELTTVSKLPEDGYHYGNGEHFGVPLPYVD